MVKPKWILEIMGQDPQEIKRKLSFYKAFPEVPQKRGPGITNHTVCLYNDIFLDKLFIGILCTYTKYTNHKCIQPDAFSQNWVSLGYQIPRLRIRKQLSFGGPLGFLLVTNTTSQTLLQIAITLLERRMGVEVCLKRKFHILP